ncbi:OmpA family protein [Actinomadura sp. 7K507]|uniref:OmpA family protein n=1 Tax=Actinomadura sp. 7K507 TaxID=2530365 RepID=UPI001049D82E|nr:OmpA family protein [Actinomadura sp. 7K507]TDC77105.1 OmpA family protein [Actinomadura sp. 7K507]
MRRTILVTGVLGAALAIPSVAGAEPDVPDAGIRKSVHTIEPGKFVRGIDLSKAVVPLETEEDNGRQVTVRLSADVLFDFGKATLTRTAERRVSELAERLRDVGGTVEVSGHTDSVGDDDYNLTLSKRRAEAVKAGLERALGGARIRIEAKGHGETEPVAPNEKGGDDNPDGRAKNRRVDITYEKG